MRSTGFLKWDGGVAEKAVWTSRILVVTVSDTGRLLGVSGFGVRLIRTRPGSLKARALKKMIAREGRAMLAHLERVNSDLDKRTRRHARIQKLEDLGTKYYAKAMHDEIESAHIYARINERYCAMQGWTSVNIRLDPYAAQVQQQALPRHEKIRAAIMRLTEQGPPVRRAVISINMS